MFHKLQAVIKNAVDALTPELPSHENFVFHWKSVTNYFIESTDDKVPVQSTNIPYSLEHMLEILRLEDEENGGSTAGPCLEYLLQHKILETLHTLGKADCPPGMKQQVLQFFTNLLGKVKTPLLPHVNVHKPIHRLIHVCGQIQAAPSENEEVQFLCTVAAKLRMYPNLVNFFLEMPYQHSSNLTDASSSPSKQRLPEKPQYSLVNSLLQLSKSEDRRIAVKACEGLMLCSSIPDDHAASVIILYTPFCEVMVDCLTGLFKSLPNEMEPADIANIVAKWGLDRSEGGTNKFSGKRSLLSFLSWLDYIDQLIRESHQLIGKALSSALRERCLEASFKPSLLEISESHVITITALLTKCLRMVSAPKTVEEFVSFLMGNSSGEDSKPQENNEKKSLLMETLIERCNHISDSVTIETLRLLECLLEKPVEGILDELVLKYLADRKYVTAVTNGEQTKNNGDVGTSRDEESSTSKVNELDRIELEKIVNSFLFLLPGEVKSSTELGGNGYDSYLRDAHRQCAERRNQCKSFQWPKTAVAEGASSSDGPFFEGDFLNILFKKLKNILDQPYDVNLQVTSVLALLSQFPHPQLHEYLLNPTLPLTPGAKSLTTILREVVEDLKARVEILPNFKQRLLHTRKRLMSLQSVENKSEPQLNLLQGVVVLEEFCKELAAIAFVKATNTMKER